MKCPQHEIFTPRVIQHYSFESHFLLLDVAYTCKAYGRVQQLTGRISRPNGMVRPVLDRSAVGQLSSLSRTKWQNAIHYVVYRLPVWCDRIAPLKCLPRRIFTGKNPPRGRHYACKKSPPGEFIHGKKSPGANI